MRAQRWSWPQSFHSCPLSVLILSFCAQPSRHFPDKVKENILLAVDKESLLLLLLFIFTYLSSLWCIVFTVWDADFAISVLMHSKPTIFYTHSQSWRYFSFTNSCLFFSFLWWWWCFWCVFSHHFAFVSRIKKHVQAWGNVVRHWGSSHPSAKTCPHNTKLTRGESALLKSGKLLFTHVGWHLCTHTHLTHCSKRKSQTSFLHQSKEALKGEEVPRGSSVVLNPQGKVILTWLHTKKGRKYKEWRWAKSKRLLIKSQRQF